jgi:hypothetical protein
MFSRLALDALLVLWLAAAVLALALDSCGGEAPRMPPAWLSEYHQRK